MFFLKLACEIRPLDVPAITRCAPLSMAIIIVLSGNAIAHDVISDGSGGISIGCSNGARAVGRLQGTVILFEITNPDGSQSGISVAPSEGGSGAPDPAVAIGDGSSLASEVCGL